MSDIAADDLPTIDNDRFASTALVLIAVILGIMGVNHLIKNVKSDDGPCGTVSKPCYVRIKS